MTDVTDTAYAGIQVFVLTSRTYGEGEWVLGGFTTARTAIDRADRHNSTEGDELCLYRVFMDTAIGAPCKPMARKALHVTDGGWEELDDGIVVLG